MPPSTPAGPDHRLLGAAFHPDLRGHVADCSCGWRSRTLPTAGMAGAQWDRHVEEVEQAPEAPDPKPDGPEEV